VGKRETLNINSELGRYQKNNKVSYSKYKRSCV